MVDNDKNDFGKLLKATLGIYDKEVSVETFSIWFNSLKAYAIESVRQALSNHVQDKERGRFAPKPADIISMIERMNPDGRPSADEAWALYPRNESDSAVINDEISQAISAANTLISEGDNIAARMAFKDAYNRIVENNKAQGIRPKWFASLGHNPDARKKALDDAVRMNRITLEHAQTLLPMAKHGFVQDMLSNAPLLSYDVKFSDQQKQRNKERLAEIKKMLQAKSKTMES